MCYRAGLIIVMDDPSLAFRLKQASPISLDIELNCIGGEFLALVGPSGSGKTTTLRAIAGVYRSKHSFVRCRGSVWEDTETRIFVPPHLRKVGLVFQSYALFPHMTALANVTAAMGHLPRSERMQRAKDLLSIVHLKGLEHRRPGELSGGQQQRVAVARALARDPDVLLLDEPFSAVDKATRQRLYGELSELRRNLSIPIILVTHDFDEAARLCDRMCLLNHGRILQVGTPSEVLARPVNVDAARIVDLKNMFAGRINRHEGDRTVIEWNGQAIMAGRHDDFEPGEPVVWALPSTQILLQKADDPAAKKRKNVISGSVAEVTQMSENSAALIEISGLVSVVLSMTLPSYFVQRTQLRKGSPVTVSLVPEGIHIMKGHPDFAPCSSCELSEDWK